MELTPGKRIALNVAATYGRSLVALVCGLVTGRWMLLSLGVTDYGILGLVGGLVAFVTFFNGVLSGAVARFYALATGGGDLAECRRWFTAAVSVHSIMPLVLVGVGYPLGAWAIREGLTIPAARMDDAVWVWRFTCIGAFFSMANVPFNAMFVARQRFAEISAYGAAASLANVGVLAYVVTHPGVWLVRISAWISCLTVVQALVIMIRAGVRFESCRIVREHLWNRRDVAELVRVAGWMTVGSAGYLLRGSGMVVLVNKLFGPAKNATLAVANTVTDQSTTLWGAILTAFQPAITAAYGAGDLKRMEELSNVACKFGTLALLPFVVSLALEVDGVLELWLKTPPEGAGRLCIWVMAAATLDRTATGLWPALDARGRFAVSKPLAGLAMVSALAFAWMLVRAGWGLDGVGLGLCLAAALCAVTDAVVAHALLGFSALRWLLGIVLPFAVAAGGAVAAGVAVKSAVAPSLGRMALTTVVANLALLPLVWWLAFSAEDRVRVRIWIGRHFRWREI